jgi:hypothetical protein
LGCASFRVFKELLQQYCWVGFITARLNSVCYTIFLVTELCFCWVGGLCHTHTALVCCCLEGFQLGWWKGRRKLTLRSFGWNMILGLWTSESFSIKGHNSVLSFKHFCRILESFSIKGHNSVLSFKHFCRIVESFSIKGHNSFLSFKHFCRIVESFTIKGWLCLALNIL